MNHKLIQDLHIHTIFSSEECCPEQTLEMINEVRHADIIGISDHFEQIQDVETYFTEVKRFHFHVGTEIDGTRMLEKAVEFPFEYFFYHCRDHENDYNGIDKLLKTGKPVIISHPNIFNTDPLKIPKECFVEINNSHVLESPIDPKLFSQFEDHRQVSNELERVNAELNKDNENKELFNLSRLLYVKLKQIEKTKGICGIDYLKRFTDKFKIVLTSDAHFPNQLNQIIARHVANKLGINETILFSS